MPKINVLQNDGELLKQVIINAFHECHVDVEFSNDSDLAIFTANTQKKSGAAKIVISPNAKSIETNAHQIITYGLCCKNTLTISSCIGRKMILSLQRSLKTLNGVEVEVQDFPITISDPDEPEVVLATVAALIACDIPIAEISKLPF